MYPIYEGFEDDLRKLAGNIGVVLKAFQEMPKDEFNDNESTWYGSTL